MATTPTIIGKFSSHLRSVLEHSFGIARELNSPLVKTEFFLWAMLFEHGCMAQEVLQKHAVNDEKIKEWIIRTNIQPPQPSLPLALNEEAKRMLEKSVYRANQLHHKYIGTEHLLSSLVEILRLSPTSPLLAFFKENRVDLEQLALDVATIMKTTSKFPDIAETMSIVREHAKEHPSHATMEAEEASETETPALDFFATNLTHKSFYQHLDPVVGRSQEIERVIQILLRRTKNNPLLLGEAGVGKTAIVEGLAKRIIEGDVPELLAQKKIYALDMSVLVAGSIFRGEFEARLRQVIEEIHRNPDIIVFIDELHTIMGAGAASGSLDAANILKPALARGEIRCIGATTYDEYKKYLEKDAALGRRFQIVPVSEPTAEQTVLILQGLKSGYEQFHGIGVADEAIHRAVELSHRYLPERTFPDKAIDVLDEALSSVRLNTPPDPLMKKLRVAQEKLEEVRDQKHHAVAHEEFTQALASRETEKKLLETIQYAKNKLAKKHKQLSGMMTVEDVNRVMHELTGIPMAQLTQGETEKLRNLEERLHQRIVGQTQAVQALSRSIRRAYTGFGSRTRPLGSFLFVGPSGVGKTELAKTLAKELFGHASNDGLIRIDMSEFSEPFTVSKLIGAPAGYVGYRESGKLTDQVRQHPHSVILLDELEKAHQDVYHLLLQVLEDGRLTDGAGRTVYFHETIIIMTTNVGSESILQRGIKGFNDPQSVELNTTNGKSQFEAALKNYFRVEFLNRMDSVVFFNPLSVGELEQIVTKEIQLVNDQLAEKKLFVEIDESTRAFLARNNAQTEYGARNIRRNIGQWIETPLAELLLEHPQTSGTALFLTSKDGAPTLLNIESQKQNSRSGSTRIQTRIDAEMIRTNFVP